jgi:hypothetical protein
MNHQSRLVLLPALYDIIIDLNDIVSAKRIYYPSYDGVYITLRSNPTETITIGEPYMEKCWEILCQHIVNPPCPNPNYVSGPASPN